MSKEFECDFCDYTTVTVEQMRKHKLDIHSGKLFNSSIQDSEATKDVLFQVLAEHKAQVIEEVVSIKKSMKEIFGQVIEEFEKTMNDFKIQIKILKTHSKLLYTFRPK